MTFGLAARVSWPIAALVAVGLSGCAATAPERFALPSTTRLTLDGRVTRVDVYAPPGRPAAIAILAHGFARHRATMAGHASALARDGLIAFVPDLPYFADIGGNARAIADLVRVATGSAYDLQTKRVVLVGFSAGALSALLAASTPGVAGLVALDPFDRPSGIGLEAARSLEVPVVLLRAPPSACNAGGIAGRWTTVLPRLAFDRIFDAARHCDFEAPSDFICRLACGRPDPDRQDRIGTALRDAVRALLLLYLPDVPRS